MPGCSSTRFDLAGRLAVFRERDGGGLQGQAVDDHAHRERLADLDAARQRHLLDQRLFLEGDGQGDRVENDVACGHVRHFREGVSGVLVAVGEQHDPLAGVFRRGVELVLGGAQRLRDVGRRGHTGVAQARGVERLAGRGLRVRILREGDDADLVHRAHALRGLRDILLDRVPLVFTHALGGVHHEDDRQQLAALDDLRACQHQDQQRHQDAAQGQRQSLTPQAHIGDGMAMQPPAEEQQRRQQQERQWDR